MLESFISQFLVKIQENNNIAIFVHIQPDFDAFASAFALKKWIQDNFSDKVVHLMIPPEIFKEEEKFLFSQTDPIPEGSYLADFLGIVVDTPNVDRILTQMHYCCKELIVIDHHPKIDTFAQLEFIDPTYPAVAQILSEIFSFLEEEKKYVFNAEVAQYLYAGIITDTNNFMSLSMLPSTYVVLSKLVSKGLNRNAIHNFIFVRKLNHKLFNCNILNKAKLTPNGLAYSIVTKKDITKYKMYDFPNIVNMLENIFNVEVWSTLTYEFDTNKWKCSLRSKELPINQIAKLYGGGGHRNMAATVFDKKSDYYRLLSTLDIYLINSGYKNVTLDDGKGDWRLFLYKFLRMFKQL